jgi:hypothetical protein
MPPSPQAGRLRLESSKNGHREGSGTFGPKPGSEARISRRQGPRERRSKPNVFVTRGGARPSIHQLRQSHTTPVSRPWEIPRSGSRVDPRRTPMKSTHKRLTGRAVGRVARFEGKQPKLPSASLASIRARGIAPLLLACCDRLLKEVAVQYPSQNPANCRADRVRHFGWRWGEALVPFVLFPTLSYAILQILSDPTWADFRVALPAAVAASLGSPGIHEVVRTLAGRLGRPNSVAQRERSHGQE